MLGRIRAERRVSNNIDRLPIKEEDLLIVHAHVDDLFRMRRVLGYRTLLPGSWFLRTNNPRSSMASLSFLQNLQHTTVANLPHLAFRHSLRARRGNTHSVLAGSGISDGRTPKHQLLHLVDLHLQ